MTSRSLLFLLMCFLSVPLAQAHTDAAPYVYYFSQPENGFVIEQANATRSAVLGRGIMDESQTITYGPGWSPSGAWFAWMSAASDGGPGAYASSPWIISRDGSKRLTLLDGTSVYGVNLSWSPREDLLLAFIPYKNPYRESGYLQLIDPNTETVLAQYEDTGGSWSPNGRYFIFQQNVSTDPTRREMRIFIASPDGKIISERPAAVCCGYFGYRWSPDDRLISIEPGGAHLLFEDLETRDVTRILLPTSNIRNIDWSPDGQTALIYTGVNNQLGNGIQLWALSMQAQTMHLIHDNVHENLFNGPYPGYMAVTPQNWSADSRKVIYWTPRNVYIYNVDQQTSVKTPITFTEQLYSFKTRWSPDGEHVFMNQQNDALYRYDLETNTVETIASRISNFELSPDGIYIAVGWSADCHLSAMCIYTTEGEWVSDIPLHSSLYQGGRWVEFRWHPTKPWIIVGMLQGGGSPRMYHSIVDVSGTVFREAYVCYFDAGCMDWLPPQVEIETWDAPQALPRRPDIEVKTGSIPAEIVWSPDRSQFALTTGRHIQVLDSATLYTRHEFAAVGGDINWETDGRSLLAIDYPAAYGRPDYEITRYDTSTWKVTHHHLAKQLLMNDDIIAVLNDQTQQLTVLDRATFAQIAVLEDVDMALLSARSQFITRDALRSRILVWQIDEKGVTLVREIATDLTPEEQSQMVHRDYLMDMQLNTAGDVLWINTYDRTRHYWSVDTGLRLPDSPQEAFTPTPLPASVGDTAILRKVDEEKTITFRVAETQAAVEALIAQGYEPMQVLYRNEDNSRIIIDAEPEFYIWNGVTDEILLYWVSWEKRRTAPTLAVDPQGQTVALSNQIGPWSEGTIEIYDLATMTRLDRINREAYALYWSPDSHRLIAVTHDTLSLIFVP